jgi:hypothetical protein
MPLPADGAEYPCQSADFEPQPEMNMERESTATSARIDFVRVLMTISPQVQLMKVMREITSDALKLRRHCKDGITAV